jgi:hypothetical protein
MKKTNNKNVHVKILALFNKILLGEENFFDTNRLYCVKEINHINQKIGTKILMNHQTIKTLNKRNMPQNLLILLLLQEVLVNKSEIVTLNIEIKKFDSNKTKFKRELSTGEPKLERFRADLEEFHYSEKKSEKLEKNATYMYEKANQKYLKISQRLRSFFNSLKILNYSCSRKYTEINLLRKLFDLNDVVALLIKQKKIGQKSKNIFTGKKSFHLLFHDNILRKSDNLSSKKQIPETKVQYIVINVETANLRVILPRLASHFQNNFCNKLESDIYTNILKPLVQDKLDVLGRDDSEYQSVLRSKEFFSTNAQFKKISKEKNRYPYNQNKILDDRCKLRYSRQYKKFSNRRNECRLRASKNSVEKKRFKIILFNPYNWLSSRKNVLSNFYRSKFYCILTNSVAPTIIMTDIILDARKSLEPLCIVFASNGGFFIY